MKRAAEAGSSRRATESAGAHGHADPGGIPGLVSVVIPCYAQAHFLAEAIESVRAQDYPSYEIVVVDDGSPDDTSEVAGRFAGVRCLRQPNQGLSAARNTGWRESRGEFLVFLDADDRLLPGALSAGVRALSALPACGAAFGAYRFIHSDGRILGYPIAPTVESAHYEHLLRSNFIGAITAVIFRRHALDAIGEFDRALPACEDYELLLRLARRFPMTRHETCVLEYRRHPESMSRDYEKMLRTVLAVHGTQRGFAMGEPALTRAFRDGERFWRVFYGQKLLKQAVRGAWSPATRATAWKSARGFLRHACTPSFFVAAPLWSAQQLAGRWKLRRQRRASRPASSARGASA